MGGLAIVKGSETLAREWPGGMDPSRGAVTLTRIVTRIVKR